MSTCLGSPIPIMMRDWSFKSTCSQLHRIPPLGLPPCKEGRPSHVCSHSQTPPSSPLSQTGTLALVLLPNCSFSLLYPIFISLLALGYSSLPPLKSTSSQITPSSTYLLYFKSIFIKLLYSQKNHSFPISSLQKSLSV